MRTNMTGQEGIPAGIRNQARNARVLPECLQYYDGITYVLQAHQCRVLQHTCAFTYGGSCPAPLPCLWHQLVNRLWYWIAQQWSIGVHVDSNRTFTGTYFCILTEMLREKTTCRNADACSALCSSDKSLHLEHCSKDIIHCMLQVPAKLPCRASQTLYSNPSNQLRAPATKLPKPSNSPIFASAGITHGQAHRTRMLPNIQGSCRLDHLDIFGFVFIGCEGCSRVPVNSWTPATSLLRASLPL